MTDEQLMKRLKFTASPLFLVSVGWLLTSSWHNLVTGHEWGILPIVVAIVLGFIGESQFSLEKSKELFMGFVVVLIFLFPLLSGIITALLLIPLSFFVIHPPSQWSIFLLFGISSSVSYLVMFKMIPRIPIPGH